VANAQGRCSFWENLQFVRKCARADQALQH
jgi:hypothetical protein